MNCSNMENKSSLSAYFLLLIIAVKILMFFFILCSLDTFPYAGTTTTCESLYMGVPCVTMAGLVHANNVGVTLLHQIGNDCLQFLTYFCHNFCITFL